MKRLLAAGFAGLALILFPATALASIGVGVGTGRIDVTEQLKNGGIYKLPEVTVFNTGTQTANYSMAVTLNESQAERKPDPHWFSFSPDNFTLEPHESQVVTPTINLPISTPPGKYFAYLEAHPAETAQQGATAVGVAAAAKLSFTVAPSNIFYGIYFRLLSLYKQFAPYSYIATAAIILAILWRFIRKKVHLEISVKKKGKQ